MIEKGYKFKKDEINYTQLGHYVDTIIDALKDYTIHISAKKNRTYLNYAESLKHDIINLQQSYIIDTEFSKVLPFKMHSKSAKKLISKKNNEIKERRKVLKERIKSNIVNLEYAPSTLGIKENKDTGMIETKSKYQLYSNEEKRTYGFYSYIYEGEFAVVNGKLLKEMYDICDEKSQKDEFDGYEKNRKYIEEQKEKNMKEIISINEYLFKESFDTAATVKENPDKIHVLRELSEINEEKYCLGLEIPDEVYKKATPIQLRKIEKYKKIIDKKKEILAKIEQQTIELIEPRKNKFDIKLAIEYLNSDSKIPIDTKEKLLKELNIQLRKEMNKETKIHKQIDYQRKKGKIGSYDKNKYKLYSNMAIIQEEYKMSSLESANRKTFLEEDIKILNKSLENKSLTEERKSELQEELDEKRTELYNLGSNCLNVSERHSHKEKIISFWEYTIEREVSSKKIQEPLLLTDGMKNERNEFLSDLKFQPDHIINTSTNKNIESRKIVDHSRERAD